MELHVCPFKPKLRTLSFAVEVVQQVTTQQGNAVLNIVQYLEKLVLSQLAQR